VPYDINKKRLPKKKNDINNIRCLVLGVLNHFQVNAELLGVTQNRYETYVDALIEAKVLLREKGSKGYNIETFVVFDENKVDEYTKTSFYKFIEKRIVPLFKGANAVKGMVK
jgi:cysteinyl-tRNA synthetase